MSESGSSTSDQESAMLFWEDQSFLTTPTRAGPRGAEKESQNKQTYKHKDVWGFALNNRKRKDDQEMYMCKLCQDSILTWK